MPITVSGTSITFNDSTTQTTAFTGGGGVTSLNGQTGAVVTTDLNGIGSIMAAALNTTSNVLPNSTHSGGNLYYANAVSQIYDNRTWYTQGSFNNPPNTSVGISNQLPSFYGMGNLVNGNTGWVAPGGSATLSGTWRLLTPLPARVTSYNSCDNRTSTATYGGLFVRVS